ncbi:MAG TPA: tetratricopeptide repeat protein [Anaeromyxobacter sp.]
MLGAAAAGCALTFAACVLWVRDPDLFHHLALGRHVWRHGVGPAEPFLFPLQGEPIGIPPYWLGSLLLFGWHALLGDGGLAFLPAVVGAALFSVLLADARPRGEPNGPAWLAAAALPLLLAIEAYRPRAAPRPEILGMLLLAGTSLAIRRWEEGRPRLLLAFPLAALAWSNLHPSIAAGLALVGVLAVTATFRPGPWRERLGPAAILVAAVAATAVNPSPANPVGEALRFAATLVGAGGSVGAAAAAGEGYAPVRMLIGELALPTRSHLASPAGVLALVTVASFVLAWTRPRVREVLVVAAFAFLASRAVRFGAFLAVVCAPIAARNLAAALSRLPARAPLLERLRIGPRVLGAGALVALAPLHGLLAPGAPELSFATGLWPPAYPVRAADYLQSIGFDGHLYDTFQFGGYLEWRGFSPYQDGRGTVPPGTLEASLLGPDDPRTWPALDARWGFDALVLQYVDRSYARAETLRALKGEGDWIMDRTQWALVAFDDGGLLYLRRDGRYAALAARDEYRLAKPGNASVEVRRSTLGALLAEYDRAIRETPSCARCRFLFANCALAAGRPGDAVRALEPALEAAPWMPELVLAAARAAEADGQPARALALYRRALAEDPEDREARRGLARRALAAGDVDGADRALRPLVAAADAEPADLALAAQIASARGRPEDAAALLARAKRDDGAQTAAREQFDRALAAERLRDFPGAAASYEASLAAFERNPAAHSNLGYVYEKLGRLDDALREQRRALELDPGLAAAHYGVGTALAERGDRAEATAAFRRYLALEPQGYFALKATQKLAKLERP